MSGEQVQSIVVGVILIVATFAVLYALLLEIHEGFDNDDDE